MQPFVGYSQRPSARWPYFLTVGLIIIFILLFITILGSFFNREKVEKPVEKKLLTKTTAMITLETTVSTVAPPIKNSPVTTISPLSSMGTINVESLFLTPSIENNQPGIKIGEFSKAKYKRVYCYLKVSAAKLPQEIVHVWISPKGTKVASIKQSINRSPAYAWSYMNLAQAAAGLWQINIQDAAGNLLFKQTFLLRE